MEWYFVLGAFAYLAGAVFVYKYFDFVYADDKVVIEHKGINIVLALLWPIWLLPLSALDAIKRLRGK